MGGDFVRKLREGNGRGGGEVRAQGTRARTFPPSCGKDTATHTLQGLWLSRYTPRTKLTTTRVTRRRQGGRGGPRTRRCPRPRPAPCYPRGAAQPQAVPRRQVDQRPHHPHGGAQRSGCPSPHSDQRGACGHRGRHGHGHGRAPCLRHDHRLCHHHDACLLLGRRRGGGGLRRQHSRTGDGTGPKSFGVCLNMEAFLAGDAQAVVAVLSFLPTPDLLSMRAVCKPAAAASHADVLWRGACARDFCVQAPVAPEPPCAPAAPLASPSPSTTAGSCPVGVEADLARAVTPGIRRGCVLGGRWRQLPLPPGCSGCFLCPNVPLCTLCRRGSGGLPVPAYPCTPCVGCPDLPCCAASLLLPLTPNASLSFPPPLQRQLGQRRRRGASCGLNSVATSSCTRGCTPCGRAYTPGPLRITLSSSTRWCGAPSPLGALARALVMGVFCL